jgi:hypothetical protein
MNTLSGVVKPGHTYMVNMHLQVEMYTNFDVFYELMKMVFKEFNVKGNEEI